MRKQEGGEKVRRRGQGARKEGKRWKGKVEGEGSKG